MISRSILIVAVVCVAPVVAQSCYAENDGPGFNNAVSMGGPNPLLAVKFTAPSTLTVNGIEVFTGESTGANTVSLWSNDAGNNQPMASLGTGTWAMSSSNSWQGAALSAPVVIVGGATYWMVWGCQNGSQAAVDVASPTAVIQQYRGTFNGGATWNGPFSFANRPWKFRLQCAASLYQVNQVGASLDVNGVMTGGLTPAITTIGASTGTATIAGTVGQPWDIAYTVNDTLVPSGLITTAGQVVNLNFTAPSFAFAFGAAFANSLAPFSTSVALGGLTTFEAQLMVLDPTSPDAFWLSQAIQIN